jgi:hypothetical protein
MTAWKQYSVLPAGGFYPSTDDRLKLFDKVSHTSHIDSALNIIGDGEIKPGLVFDKSHLNTHRILVAWLSPNHWFAGYRYGNIKFDYDFKGLIANKRFYWVEAIPYSPHACRILITDQDRSGLLTPYDPSIRDGPWWHDTASDKHYYNGKYCLEFMIEESVTLQSLIDLSFVDHHNSFCSVHRFNPIACSQKGDPASIGGAKFLMKAAARQISLASISKFFVLANGNYTTPILLAIAKISRQLKIKSNYGGKVDFVDTAAEGLCRAILNAIVNGNKDEANKLAGLFDEEESLLISLSELIHNTLGVGHMSDVIGEIF